MKTIPKGWEVSEDGTISSGIVSIPAGAGYGVVAPAVVVSQTVPNAIKAYLQELLCRVVSGGSDQMNFSVLRNGLVVDGIVQRVHGVAFDSNPRYSVDLIVDPGLLSIVAFNKSGTTEPGASAAVAIDVQAILTLSWLRDTNRTRQLQNYANQAALIERQAQ